MSDTRDESYRAFNSSGRNEQVKRLILQALRRYGPLTRRQLSEKTATEICSLCGGLTDLVRPKPPRKSQITEAFTALCPTTGRRVIHYAIIKREVA